jgi:K+-sensing histidine kinase KdpD
LKVGDEIIGEFSINDSDNPQEEANDLISAVATQLGAHIENLRLSISNMRLLKSTEERAEREQTLRQITNALRSSTNPATILRTAVRELGSVLGRKTIVRLVSPEKANQAESAVSHENETDSPANRS